jgi:hypothetical protein
MHSNGNGLRPSSAIRTLAIIFCVATLAGCHHHHHPSGPHAPVPIVAGIEVHEHDALGSRLEIEVHLYDADSNELLACSGDANGLAEVNEPDIRYRTHAEFVRPYHDHETLRLRHIEGRALFVRVYEDDSSRCPSPAGPSDDFVGQSPVFYGDEIEGGIVMQFDDVAYLRLSMGY